MQGLISFSCFSCDQQLSFRIVALCNHLTRIMKKGHKLPQNEVRVVSIWIINYRFAVCCVWVKEWNELMKDWNDQLVLIKSAQRSQTGHKLTIYRWSLYSPPHVSPPNVSKSPFYLKRNPSNSPHINHQNALVISEGLWKWPRRRDSEEAEDQEEKQHFLRANKCVNKAAVAQSDLALPPPPPPPHTLVTTSQKSNVPINACC